MMRRLGRLGVVLLVPLAFTLAGCAETVVGDGQIAEGASPTPEPTDDSTDDSTDDFTDDFTDSSSDFTDDSSDDPGGGGDPADVDAGETWLYSDDFEIAITAVAPYDGSNGIILSDEYAVKLSIQMVNGSDVPVDVSSFNYSGECEGGGLIEDSIDDSLNEPNGEVAPGQTAAFEEGVAIDLVAAKTPCTIEITPGFSYEPALFVFTAP